MSLYLPSSLFVTFLFLLEGSWCRISWNRLLPDVAFGVQRMQVFFLLYFQKVLSALPVVVMHFHLCDAASTGFLESYDRSTHFSCIYLLFFRLPNRPSFAAIHQDGPYEHFHQFNFQTEHSYLSIRLQALLS